MYDSFFNNDSLLLHREVVLISIKVVDAIMGTGKTSAVIDYINTHPDERYIYITPYLEQAHRIKSKCPDAHFVEPSNRCYKYQFRKLTHTASLIKQGCNIASTHQAFKNYTTDMLADIMEMGYTLFIDENVDVLELLDINIDDIRLAMDAGYIELDSKGIFRVINDDYDGVLFSELFDFIRTHDVSTITYNNEAVYFYWTIPTSLITSFNNVYICTYLFESQSLHHLLVMNKIPYELIGVERTPDGGYRFGSYPSYVPDYVAGLKDKINILCNKRLNEIGDNYYALSKNWFDHSKGVDQLQRNIYNYFRRISPERDNARKLWGTFKSSFSQLKGKGYTKSFTPFNTRATNDYRDRDTLVYVANVFMNVVEKTYYYQHGIEVDEDMYATSIMVQWIWRSAIRDGKEVFLYIPSRRMRTLLINWINGLTHGGAND